MSLEAFEVFILVLGLSIPFIYLMSLLSFSLAAARRLYILTI